MAPKRNNVVVFLAINNEKDAKYTFPKDYFIVGCWVNFQGLEDEGFLVKGLINHVGWTPFLEKFSS